MTPEEILEAASDYNIRAVESKKGRSLWLPRLVMESDSPLSWSLQMLFDKNGFSEFELRPQKENSAGALLGVADNEAYAKELDRVVRQTYGVPAKEWWNVRQQAETRVKKTYAQTAWYSTPETTYQYAIPVAGGYKYGSTTTPSSSYPVTRSYKYFTPFPSRCPSPLKIVLGQSAKTRIIGRRICFKASPARSWAWCACKDNATSSFTAVLAMW